MAKADVAGKAAPGLDFSTVIASTVHDMKNSLGMLLQAYGAWLEALPDNMVWTSERGIIEYESGRLNGMLVQLLGLYKMGINQLPMHPAWQDLEDFVQSQLAMHQELLQSRHIACNTRLEGDVFEGFFDSNLMGTVISNVLINTIRYARAQIQIRIWVEDPFTVIAVEDDGQGYPEAMVKAQSNYILGINQSSGSTGLGLYFSDRIAALHQRNGICGRIELSNDSSLGGGMFKILIP